jgi:TetR/AcrR family transcriptional repressor of nem operon
MKVSREQALENRERILDTAARLFRERGFDGIGVADLMKGAGLTHGGFYGQFESKEHLAAQAVERALAQSELKWQKATEGKPPREALKGVAAFYLSSRHVGDPGSGCAFAALGPEATRREPGVRHAFTEALAARVARLMKLVEGKSDAERRRRSLATMASMVGAVVLARAVDDAKLSAQILNAVGETIEE